MGWVCVCTLKSCICLVIVVNHNLTCSLLITTQADLLVMCMTLRYMAAMVVMPRLTLRKEFLCDFRDS